MTDSVLPSLPKELNQAQRAALDLSSNCALIAAAGSGKTTVLIERFLKILRHNEHRPEQIVAITFTEEAARQLRERIRVELEDRAAREEEKGKAGPWNRALTHLPRSPITTIHGFCHRLLKEYAWGLDSEWSELELLDPSRQHLLAAAAVRRTLRESSSQRRETLRTLLQYLPWAGLEELFGQMLRKRHHLVPQAGLDEEWLRDLYLRESATVILRAPEWDRLADLLRSVPGELLHQPNPVSVRCREQLELLECRETLDRGRLVERLALTLESRAVPTARWRQLGIWGEISDLWKILRRRIVEERRVDGCTEEGDRHFREALECVHELHRETLRRYESEKQAEGGRDFEDLLLSSARLVRRADVVQAIQKRFRFFLVDEFQDTNDLQWQILLPLVREPSNLLVVGDPKQSIYRFRDADVSIFSRVQSWIEGNGRVIEMRQNYRAAPGLIDFCNRICARMFSGDLEYEASHQPMEGCRPGFSDGKVESFFYEFPAGAKSSGPEPFLVASAVEHLLEEGFRYGEVAILLRARTRLKFYEESLRRKGIPFQTIGGTGFYRRQEILDLLNLLRFLHRPGNDRALLGVLRSPFFSMTDEDLVRLAAVTGDQLWDKLGRASRAGEAVSRSLAFAREHLAVWLQRAAGTPVSLLLETALEETGFLAILDASIRGEQAGRNVAKLMALVRNLERERRVHLREVVRVVEGLTRADPNEPEAEVLRPGEDAVRIFTIHGAKGLEFRAVVLPELGRRVADLPGDRFILESFPTPTSRISYLGFKIFNPSDRYRDLRHPSYQMLRRLDRYRQLAEEKRLLYVALTRAQDRLVLLGEKTEGECYYQWLQAAGSDELTVIPNALERALGEWVKKEGAESALPEPVPVGLSAPEVLPAPAPRETLPSGIRNFLRKSTWSPTELTALHSCPRRFFLGEVLAYSEGGVFGEGMATDPAPLLLGEVVHDLLEKTRDPGDVLESGARLESWRRTVEARARVSWPEFAGEVLRHLGVVAGSQIHREMQTASTSFREQDFHIRRGPTRLTGILDALYQREDSTWILVDFKTVDLRNRPALEVASDRGFLIQVELYLWAAHQILKTSDVRAVLFFTSTGETVEVNYSQALCQRCERRLDDLPVAMVEASFPLTTQPALCPQCGFKSLGLCPGAEARGPIP